MKISDDNNEDLICFICYVNNKNTFFIPCRHMFCEECIKKIMEKNVLFTEEILFKNIFKINELYCV